MHSEHTISATQPSFEVVARWTLRRVRRDTVRRHEPGFFTDAGSPVPDWFTAAW